MGITMKDRVREIFISGYGPEKGSQPSIALYEITNDLEITKELWKDSIESPSFLCTYHDNCFAIREESDSGTILSYQRIGDSYVLRDELLLTGGALCHLVYQPQNSVLYCSFYETGHIAAIRIENYHFSKVLNFFEIPPIEAGGLSRVHCGALEPDGSGIFFTNIAQDRIYFYETKEGVLITTPFDEMLNLKKGIGPRHIKFHPLLNYLYVITEYSNEIYAFKYEKENGKPKFTHLQNISTLSDNFTGKSTGASLDISKDGRFLYASNRGADTIAVFDISPDGLLTKIQEISCGGKCPRHIALTKDDKGLLIANQESNEVILFSVDESIGKLIKPICRKYFYKPSFVEEL